MQDTPTGRELDNPRKRHPVGTERHRNTRVSKNAKANHTLKKKSWDNFLIKSGIQPLVFVGHCTRQFGFVGVAAFLLGAVSVYGYAIFRPLPYAKATEPPSQLKTIWLHGNVRDKDDKPMKEEFEIGVLAIRKGPFQDGSYSIPVPESDHYLVTLWNLGYQKFKLVELKADSAGNVNDVVFPADVTRPESSTNRQTKGSSSMYTAVGDKRLKERPNAPSALEKETKTSFANLSHLDKRSQL
jgi:hypothetical protein